jgi:hypothetical protein
VKGFDRGMQARTLFVRQFSSKIANESHSEMVEIQSQLVRRVGKIWKFSKLNLPRVTHPTNSPACHKSCA